MCKHKSLLFYESQALLFSLGNVSCVPSLPWLILTIRWRLEACLTLWNPLVRAFFFFFGNLPTIHFFLVKSRQVIWVIRNKYIVLRGTKIYAFFVRATNLLLNFHVSNYLVLWAYRQFFAFFSEYLRHERRNLSWVSSNSSSETYTPIECFPIWIELSVYCLRSGMCWIVLWREYN